MRPVARVLMCPPDHFELRYAINPWMQPDRVRIDRARAGRQWRALCKVLAQEAALELLKPSAGLPDLVFTANAGLVFGRRVVPARFRHSERQGEEARVRAWFAAAGFELCELPEGLVFEGAGDALFEHEGRRVWLGCGPRSDARVAPALAKLLGIDVEPLRLVDPRFYHLDTCFCPLPRGGLLWFPAAFDSESRLRVEAAFAPDRRISVVEAEAVRFACNAVCLGERVIGDGIGDATEARLAHLGFDVERVQLDEFQKSGGSAKCLVLRLDCPPRAAPPAAAQSRAASQSRTPSAARRPLAKQAVSR